MTKTSGSSSCAETTPDPLRDRLDKRLSQLESRAVSLEAQAEYAEKEAEIQKRIADARAKIQESRPRGVLGGLPLVPSVAWVTSKLPKSVGARILLALVGGIVVILLLVKACGSSPVPEAGTTTPVAPVSPSAPVPTSVPTSVPSDYTALKAQVTKLRSELAEVTTLAESLHSQLDATDREKSQFLAELSQLRMNHDPDVAAKLAALQERHAQLTTQVAQLTTERNTLRTERDTLLREKAELERKLALLEAQ